MERLDPHIHARRGRGAASNPRNRFASTCSERVADGWHTDPEITESIATEVLAEHARSIITRNDSPDIGFDRSINPYRGCEHGCIYCYARPAHAYVDLSPGVDFETRLFYKADAARLLRSELARPGYRARPIALGTNTDPYQPVERERRVMRAVLEVLAECDHPLTITTKGALILRDVDLLADLARRRLVRVAVSVTTLDAALKRALEPRTAGPAARLRVVRELAAAGVPVQVMAAPIIPSINDHELEAILEAAAEAGARRADWILIRLPHEVAPLFRQWLEVHHPQRAAKVMSLINQTRGGRDYDARFGTRMRGTGAVAALLDQRFRRAVRRLGLDAELPALDCDRFRPPPPPREHGSDQLSLF